MIIWTCLLAFLLCIAGTPVLCCDCLRHYGHLSNASLTLVQTMGGQLTDQESPVPFPYKLYKYIRNAKVDKQLVFIRDSLELIAGLYRHDNLSSITWDTDKTEHFLMILHRQEDELKSCVSTHSRKVSALRKYYRKLNKSTLYRTGGGPASWEIIRKETKKHLVQLDLLVGFVVESAADSICSVSL
ncbi:interferon phi 1 [Anoplopoma fimbria]|uniref:interferon phi 1 n=1 Tax=Anoplopoma fimbria TaxID=229290 RepID=UPI0023EDBAA5|nr:interferon phi 1 [Anoplopoma fimbria]